MNIIILGGFLGSGKTTFLLQLVPFLVKQYPGQNTPVVVLENEISMTDVDSKLLQSRNMTVRNLTAGCICCTSSAQLEDSVNGIRAEYAPQYLVIEATGMAYPDLIRENLRKAISDPISIAALADASRWRKLSLAMPDFIEGQLSQADGIYVNKADLVTPEVLAGVLQDIQQRFPGKKISTITANQPLEDSIFQPIVTGVRL